MQKWRHEWWTSKLWKLLERQETYDERGYWGVVFRRRTSCPRVLFDQLVAEVKSYPEVKTHQSGDGVRAPPTIPVALKVAAALSFMRMGGLLQIHADYADIDSASLWSRPGLSHRSHQGGGGLMSGPCAHLPNGCVL